MPDGADAGIAGGSEPRVDDGWSSGDAYEAYIGRWSRRVAVGFLGWLDVAPGAAWLDVGTGTGALAAAISKLADPGSVIGIDPSPAFLEHARATIRDDRARFAPGDALRTGVPDRSVDVVVSGLVLNFVPDATAALREAGRVLRPRGVVAAYVWDYADGMQLIRRFWEAAVALDPNAAELDEARRFPLTRAGALEDAFRGAGLRSVEGRGLEVPTVFADGDDLWRPFLRGTGPAPAYVATLAPAARGALRERFLASLPARPDGSIALTARAWAARGRAP